jgi:heptosyltransferase-2
MKRKILVLELWGLGDLTFSTALLQRALQEGDEVHLVGKSHAKPLLEPTFPSIRFFFFEAGWTKFHHKYHIWNWNWRAFLRLLWHLRKEQYDVAVSTRDDPRDHLLMALIGARRRIGFSHRGSGLLLTDAVQRTGGSNQHKVEDWRDLAVAMGLSGMKEVQPRLRHEAYRSIRIDTLFAELSVPVLVLHAGARIPVRRWPVAYFEELIQRLRQEFTFHLILIPDPDGYGSPLASAADTVLHDLTLTELVDVLGRADLLLGNDSGPAHLAAACGRPTIVLFGPTNADWFRPSGAIHQVVMRDLCRYRPCFDYCRFAEPYCLTRLRPSAVWPEIRDQIRNLVTKGVLPSKLLGGSSAPAAVPKPLVVLITATYRRAEHLERMLASLEPEATPLAVLVVDNADDPATAAVVEQARARLEITRLVPGKNLSCGGGLALGEKYALEQYGNRISHLWMMDDDICLAPGALERLLAAMREEGADLACPMITWSTGEIGWFPGLLEAGPFDGLRKGKIRTPEAYLEKFGPKPVRFSWATGVSLLITREAFEEVGLHRTDFQIRGEDFEFSLRVSADRKAIFVPDAQLTHFCFSGPFTPEAIAAERRKQIAMLHNVAYIGCRLPHGRRIFRCLPGNLWRHLKNWGLSGLPEGLLAYWKGAVLGHPAGKDATEPAKLLVFAHTPPPHHGQSFMVKLMLDGLGGDARTGPRNAERKIACYHVNCRVSDDMEDIGSIRLGKVFQLLRYCMEAIACRFRYGVRTFYYVPAPGKRNALYRDWIVMALCRPFFKQLVLHWHAVGLGEWLDREGNRLERWITRLLLSKPTLSIAVTNSTICDALQFHSRHVEIVANAIPDPCPRFRESVLPRLMARLAARRKLLNGSELSIEEKAQAGGDPECFRVVYMARCTEPKGVFDALDGVALLNQQLQGSAICLRMEVAGEFVNGQEQARFEQRCLQPDLLNQGASIVGYHGFLSAGEKEAFLRQGDCFVFPSHWESFGLVLLEAMAYGLPIVTTRCAAITEVMPVNYPAMVSLHSPCEIATAIHALLCSDLFENLRSHFEDNFSESRYVAKLHAAIQNIST